MADRIVTQDNLTGVTRANTDPDQFLNDSDFAGSSNGRLTRTGVGTYAVIKDNLNASVDPTGTDNIAAGYAAGSIWVNTTANKSFVAAGESGGSMVWREIAPGGGGGTLQSAYDGGQTIDQTTAAAPIAITAGTSTATMLSLSRDTNGSANLLELTRVPTASLQAGDAINIAMGSNAIGSGVAIAHQGSGNGLTIEAAGSGNSATVTTTSALGFGMSVTMTEPTNANDAFVVDHQGVGRAAVFIGNDPPTFITSIESSTTSASGASYLRCRRQADGSVVLTVTDDAVTLGQPTNPIPLYAYAWASFNGTVTNGSAVDTTVKSFVGYATQAVGTTSPVNGLGQLLWREGTNTAASTIADLAHRAGSDSVEVLITKGGRVNAEATIVEWPIANGVSLAVGEAVAVSGGRVTKANANGNATPGFIGICLVGGTGDAGGTVYALIATSGVVRVMNSLSAGSPVFLSTSTAGAVQTTVPSGAGNLSLQIGYALDATTMVIHVEGRAVL